MSNNSTSLQIQAQPFFLPQKQQQPQPNSQQPFLSQMNSLLALATQPNQQPKPQQNNAIQTKSGSFHRDFSEYRLYYENILETLYFEPEDGEVFVYFHPKDQQKRLVTCIDISSLFQEKKQKALQIVNFFAQVKH